MTSATTPVPVTGDDPSTLRRLYVTRFAFALVWAVLLFLTAAGTGPLPVVLLVLYPLFDLIAAAVDARSPAGAGTSSRTGLVVNIVVSAVAAVGIAVAVAVGFGVPGVLRVWGTWAVVAGVVQLVVAVRRRALGGQWPMIASGTLSTVAGVSFVAASFTPAASLTGVAGYALLGGVFFLVSALRLGRV